MWISSVSVERRALRRGRPVLRCKTRRVVWGVLRRNTARALRAGRVTPTRNAHVGWMCERTFATHTERMNTIMKWTLRTVGLWALSKGLQLANDSLRQRQRSRALRARAASAAGLPRATAPSNLPVLEHPG